MKTNVIKIGIILLILTACAPQAKGPVVIGALFPLTGGLAQYGEVAQKSAMLAVEDINAAGGINGRMLEIDYQDHQCNPKTALSIFEQLTETKGIKIYTSAACSGTVLTIAPELQGKNALLLGTIVTSPKITGVSPFVFRNWASDKNEARLFAEEIKKRGFHKIGVIFEQTDYAQGLKISLENFLKDSGVQIVSESFASDATDVRTQLAKLKSENVDMLFISPQTVTSADLVLKQMVELGFKPRIFVNDNIVKAVDVLSRYKTLLEGAIGGDYVVEKSDAFNQLMSRYKQTYGSDCAQQNICAGVYDAVMLLAQAIADGESAEAVQQYLKTAEYAGVSGIIGFDENNDRENTGYTLFEVRNGKAMPIA